MTRGTTLAATAAATALLTGCGGGGSDPASSTVHFAGPDDSVAKRIDDAHTLAQATTFTARAVGHDVTFADPGGTGEFESVNNQRAAPEDIQFRIYRAAPDEAATVVVTHRGETTTFTPDRLGPGSYHFNDPSVPRNIDDKYFWAYGNWLSNGFGTADGETDTEYHVPVEFWYDGSPADPTNMNRLAVIGLETRSGDMPTGAVAEYVGETRLEARPKDAPGDWDRYRSDIRLTADFSKNTVSGHMDDWAQWTFGGPTTALPGLSYRLAEAPITGAGFATTVAPGADCADCPSIMNSEVVGAFYGPGADEAGGTIEIEFDDSGTVYIGAGVFFTSRDD